MRAFLAVVLLLTTGGLSFVATAAAWERRVLMDRDAIVELGQDVLERPAVQAALTERIQREVAQVARSAGADVSLTTSLSRPVVTEVVAGLPESALGETVLVDTHRIMVGVVRNREVLATQDGLIVLDLRAAVDQVLSLVGAAGVIDTQRIPADTGRILLVREEDVTLAFELGRAFDELAPYLIALPFVVMGVAVLISPNRAGFIVAAGVVLAGCALFRIAVLLGPAASRIREAALIDPAARDAASATYDALAWSFVRQDLIVVAMGAALLIIGLVSVTLKR